MNRLLLKFRKWVVGKTTKSGGEIFNDYNNNQANGTFSTASGSHTITTNEAETAIGKYNISNPDTIFSIGCGTKDDNRMNAIEVLKNGNIYIIGMGGYDGTNPAKSKPLQQILTEKEEPNCKVDGNMLIIYNILDKVKQNILHLHSKSIEVK